MAGPPPAPRRRGRPPASASPASAPITADLEPTPTKAKRAGRAKKAVAAVGPALPLADDLPLPAAALALVPVTPRAAPPPPPRPRSRAQAVASLRGVASGGGRRSDATLSLDEDDASQSLPTTPLTKPARRAAAVAAAAAKPMATKPKKVGKARRMQMDEAEAAALVSVLAPLARRSAAARFALTAPIPPDLADTPEAEDLRAMVALEESMREVRDEVKQRVAAKDAAALPGGGGSGGVGTALPDPFLPPLDGGDAALLSSVGQVKKGRPPKGTSVGLTGMGKAEAKTASASAAKPAATAAASTTPSAPASLPAPDAPSSAAASAVRALFDMLGNTGLLTKDAVFRLVRIARKGAAAAAAGDALREQREGGAGSAGGAGAPPPSVSEVVAHLGLRSPAHLRLVLSNRRVAHELMIQFNLRLVVHTARRYMGLGLDLADLISEGVDGLTRAIDKFDPNRGFAFSTYGTWWVRQALTRALSDQSRIVRLPVHVYDGVTKLRRASEALGEADFDSPESMHAALGAAVGMAPSKVERYLAVARAVVSLDVPGLVGGEDSARSAGRDVGLATGSGPGGSGPTPAGGAGSDTTIDPGTELLAGYGPADLMSSGGEGGAGAGGTSDGEGGAGESRPPGPRPARPPDVLRNRLDAVLASLPPRERNVLRLRYGLAAPGGHTMTLLDISAAYGVTTERIRQIEDSGLRRLRDPLRAAGVRDAADLMATASAGGVAGADEFAMTVAPPGVEAGPEMY